MALAMQAFTVRNRWRIFISSILLLIPGLIIRDYWLLSDEEAEFEMVEMMHGAQGNFEQIRILRAYRFSEYLYRKYQFESIRSRLSEHTPPENRNLLQVLVPASEDPASEFFDPMADLRGKALQLLHENNVVDFMLRPGFGLSRVPKKGMHELQFVRYAELQRIPDKLAENESEISGETVILPEDGTELIWTPGWLKREDASKFVDRNTWIEEIVLKNEWLLPSR